MVRTRGREREREREREGERDGMVEWLTDGRQGYLHRISLRVLETIFQAMRYGLFL